MADAPPDELPDLPERVGEVTVYGLRNRERVTQLIEVLASVPICPKRIFRIARHGSLRDNLCRFVGVDDWLSGALYYVQIHSWSKKGPVIGWSLDPRTYHSALRSRGTKSLRKFKGSLNLKPMRINFDVQAHSVSYGGYARKTAAAS